MLVRALHTRSGAHALGRARDILQCLSESDIFPLPHEGQIPIRDSTPPTSHPFGSRGGSAGGVNSGFGRHPRRLYSDRVETTIVRASQGDARLGFFEGHWKRIGVQSILMASAAWRRLASGRGQSLAHAVGEAAESFAHRADDAAPAKRFAAGCAAADASLSARPNIALAATVFRLRRTITYLLAAGADIILVGEGAA